MKPLPRLHRMILATACGLALAGCPGGGDSHGNTNATAGADRSLNWSGYVLTGLPDSFDAVGGSWVVPAVTCDAERDTFSAAWVGVGGGTAEDPTLVQAGTDQDCSGGASYGAWWEVIPAPAVGASGGLLGEDFPVFPGDRVTVTVDGRSLAVWELTIVNATQDWTFSTTVPYSAAGATAEWIMEAPITAGSGGAGLSALANYGRMGFRGLTANGARPGLTIDQAVLMVDGGDNVISQPSAPEGGDAFDVCFGPEGCP
jgi:hypothetical protein